MKKPKNIEAWCHEAMEMMEDLIGYAGEYFIEKYKYRETLDSLREGKHTQPEYEKERWEEE